MSLLVGSQLPSKAVLLLFNAMLCFAWALCCFRRGHRVAFVVMGAQAAFYGFVWPVLSFAWALSAVSRPRERRLRQNPDKLHKDRKKDKGESGRRGANARRSCKADKTTAG